MLKRTFNITGLLAAGLVYQEAGKGANISKCEPCDTATAERQSQPVSTVWFSSSHSLPPRSKITFPCISASHLC